MGAGLTNESKGDNKEQGWGFGAGIIDDRMVGGWDQERRMEPGMAVSRWEPGLEMGARV